MTGQNLSPGWLPALADLLHARPDLHGIGLAEPGVLPEWSA